MITVNAAGTDTVILRNIDLSCGSVFVVCLEPDGVVFQSGATVVLENSTISAYFSGSAIKLTNPARCLLEVRNVQIVGATTGVNIAGGKATVFLRKVSITNANTGIISTPSSEIFLTEIDLLNNTVATTGYYFNSFNDNHFVGNGSNGVLSQ